MKKLNYLILGLAGLAVASCSQDDMLNAPQGEGNYNITVQLPADMATRANGDGLQAQNLTCVVYQEDGTYVETKDFTFPANSNQTTVGLALVPGISYNISFFAQSPTAVSQGVYTLDGQSKTLTVNYDKMTTAGNNGDAYDCFYKLHETGVIGGSTVNTQVVLTRPIAKVNWGTSDINEASVAQVFGAGAANLEYTLTTQAYCTLDLFNGEPGNQDDITVGTFGVVTGWSSYPAGDDYSYMAMQYLLAPTEEGIYDLNLEVNSGSAPADFKPITINVASAPVQANFQTNIYGSLLTDQVNFNVTKSAEWGAPDYLIGLGTQKPQQATDGTYLITTQAELNWVAEQVNSGALQTSGTKFSLQNDIYMNGEWTPIGTSLPVRFNGTFEGNGNTIHNLSVTSNSMTGFFGFMNGVVENLNFDNATVNGNHWAGVVAGFSDNETGSCVINNCKVTNSTVILTPEQVTRSDEGWDNGDKGGLICGYMVRPDHITNCTVENCTLSGYRDLGGILGYANGAVNVDGNTVNGLTIYINNTHNYNNYTDQSQYDANAIVGEGPNIVGNNNSSNVTISFGALVNTSESLADAVSGATSGSVVTVKSGTYTFPNITDFSETGIVIDCEPGVVFSGNTSWGYKGSQYGLNQATIKNATFSSTSGNTVSGYLNANFENCTFEGSNAVRGCYASGNCEFTDCEFVGNGVYAFHVDSPVHFTDPTLTFNGCDFDGFVAVGNKVNYVFNDCTFKINPSSKYGGGNFWGESTFTKCQFFLPQPLVEFQYIALAVSGNTYKFTDCTNEGTLITTDFDFKGTTGAIVNCNGVTKTF